MKERILLIIGLLISVSVLPQAHGVVPQVKTPVGTFVGVEANGMISYLGIRYGTPPVGELRFLPSTLWQPSDANAVYNATAYGAECWQPSISSGPSKDPPMSEDCLFLNVFVPSHPVTSGQLPIVFWIHGGGFLLGSSATYPVQVLTELSSAVIVVSINYRLGPLGLLSSAELYAETGRSGGINAVGDQLTALAWVRNYLPYFGGDIERITVMGESAGGISSGIILITPALTTNIQYATVQSGPLFGLTPLDFQQGIDFATQACQVAGFGACNLTQLRAVEPGVLLNTLLQAGLAVLKHPPAKAGAWPWSVDGGILPELPRAMLAQLGSKYPVNAAAVITGFVSMDGIISPPLNRGVPPLPTSAQQYQAYIEAYFGANQTQVALLNSTYYPLDAFGGNAAQAWTQMNADACWVCPTLGLNQALLASAPSTALYTFEFLGAQAPQYLSAHGGDVYFLFHMPLFAEYFRAGWNRTLSSQMQQAWTSFVLHGVPDLGISTPWPLYTSDEQSVMLLQAGATRPQPHFSASHHANACSFWLDPSQVSPSMFLSMCWEYPQPSWPGSGF